MKTKKIITMPYIDVPTEQLKDTRQRLVARGKVLLRRHEYFEAQMIKEDIASIDQQLKARGLY